MSNTNRANPGDTIRILKDNAGGARVKAGDVFEVMTHYDKTGILVCGPDGWWFEPENYEIVKSAKPMH